MTSPHWGAVVPGTLKRQRWREPPPPPRAGPWEQGMALDTVTARQALAWLEPALFSAVYW